MIRRPPVLCAAIALLVGCDGVQENRVEVGHPAPDYAAVTLAGDSVDLRGLEGEVVLLNVWATWCAPCREEIPALQEIYETYRDRGFELVGVTVDGRGEGEAIQRFAADFAMTYPIWHDPDGLVYSRYRIIGVPSTFLIGRDGTLLWQHMGPLEANDERLVQHLQLAFGED